MSTTGEASKTTTNLETEQSCKVDSCGQMSKSQQSKGEVVGGKRGGGNRMLKSLSYALSKVLRHSAIRDGLSMSPDGYVSVEELLQLPKFKKFTLEDLEAVVSTNDKQRFELAQPSREIRDWRIRARQGHSISLVQEELLLQKITDPEDAPLCIHGTFYNKWALIKENGLNRMSRNHIHFAAGLPGSDNVISGMRRSVEVLIYVDVKLAMEQGIQFFRSSNGVVLSSGINGVIPTVCFLKVVDAKTGRKLT